MLPSCLVQPHLDVTVSDALEIDHGRCDITVAHPLLERGDVDAVLQVPGRVGMAEFVKKPAAAKRAFGATIDFQLCGKTWKSAASER
jgi:hypothetical protein